MTDDFVDARVRKVFAEVLSEEVARDLTAASTTESVSGWDSKTFVAIVMGLENAFSMTFSALEAVRMGSVSEIQELLREKGATLRA